MIRQNPPRADQHGGRRGVYTEEVKELRSSPSVWFVIAQWKKPTDKDKVRAGALANAIKNGRYTAFRPGGAFEAVRRLHDDGTLKVHVKYNGKDTEDKLAEAA